MNQTSGITETSSLADDLIGFYDDFLRFQAYCALLCDAMTSLASTQMELDDATRRGIEMFAGYLKRRVEEMALALKAIQEKSCEVA